MKVKVIDIGNSKGIRLPQTILRQYHILNDLEIELKKDGILLKPFSKARDGWEEQFKKGIKKLTSAEKELMQLRNKFDEEEWTW
jgi:antitoxin MazE